MKEPMITRRVTLFALVLVAAALSVATADQNQNLRQDQEVVMKAQKENNNEQIIFDFQNDKSLEPWDNVDDVVMGGVSSSKMVIKNKMAVFEGNVSLENRGGFASVRSRQRDHDLAVYDGIAIRVRSDDKQYSLRIRTAQRFDDVGYTAPLKPKGGKWVVTKVPFCMFRPVYRGRAVPDYPELDPGKIKMFGLLISQKQQGPFRLEVQWFKAYKEPFFAEVSAVDDLSQFRGKKRLLVISAGSPDDELSGQQRWWIQENAEGFREREMALVELFGTDSPGRSALRSKLRLEKGVFTVLLVGKDGSEKLRRQKPVPMAEVFELIDSMPMRKQEMSQGKD
jgi:monofunctional biosynthetic peptidoglycan transglycosylase